MNDHELMTHRDLFPSEADHESRRHADDESMYPKFNRDDKIDLTTLASDCDFESVEGLFVAWRDEEIIYVNSVGEPCHVVEIVVAGPNMYLPCGPKLHLTAPISLSQLRKCVHIIRKERISL